MSRPNVLEDRHYLRLAEAAAALGMHQDTLRKYMRNGTLVPALRGETGVFLFTEEWIERARRVLGGSKRREVVNG